MQHQVDNCNIPPCISHVSAKRCFALAGVTTSKKHYEADVVVLAAALGIPELAQQLQLQVPLVVKPHTVTVITKPLKHFLKHIVVTGTV